jgi:long-chain acyl-CoA synthetase
MLLGEILRTAARRDPAKVALWFGRTAWTYAELDDVTDRVAGGLTARGLGPGDRVGLFLQNCPELLFSYFACFKLGAIAVPLNYRYRQPEAHYALHHSGARALIVHQALVGEAKDLPFAELGIADRWLVGEECVPGFTPFEDLLHA